MKNPGKNDNVAASVAAILSWTYLAGVALFVLHACYIAACCHYTFPRVDDWRILNDLFSKPLGEWIITPQNGHRSPFLLSLFYVDYTFFSGRMHFLTAVSLVCAAIALTALWGSVFSSRMRPTPLRTSAFAFACYCLVWSWSQFDLVWAVNQGTVMAAMWLLVALWSMSCYCAQRSRGEAPSWSLPAIAAVAAFVGTFSQPMGFAIWPCLLVIALAGRLPIKVALLFAAGASISLVLYVSGTENTGHVPIDRYLPLILQSSELVFRSTAGLVGSSASFVIEALFSEGWSDRVSISRRAGFAGLIFLASYTLVLLVAPRRCRPREVLGLGLMWFSAMVGIMVALNRYQMPGTGMAIRFITASTLFWIGAGVTVTSLIQSWRSHWMQAAAIAVLGATSVAMLPSLGEQRALHARERDQHAMRAIMHGLGVRYDPFTRWKPFGKPKREDATEVYRTIARLEADRRSFFAEPWVELPGRRIGNRFAIANPGSCSGRIDEVQKLVTRGRPAGLFRGSVETWSERPSRIVITDGLGIIRGLGTLKTASSSHAGRAWPGQTKRTLWSGMSANYDTQASYDAYAISPDGTTACRFASWAKAGHRPIIEAPWTKFQNTKP